MNTHRLFLFAPVLKFLPWFLAARPKTLPAGIAPVILGAALAGHVDSFQWIPTLLCLFFSLLVQIGCNYANDYYDFINGVDTHERIGFKRMVSSGFIKPEAMKRATFLILTLAFIVGCGLMYYGGWWLIVVGLASIVCAVAYTGGPYPIGYYGLGDVFVFIFYGLVAVNFTFFVQTGYFGSEVFWVAAACGLLAANIRLVNDVRDRQTDEKAGKRTLAVRFGKSFSFVQYWVSMIFGIVVVPIVLVVKYQFNLWVLISILMVIFGVQFANQLSKVEKGYEYNKLLEKTAKLLLGFAILLGIGMAI